MFPFDPDFLANLLLGWLNLATHVMWQDVAEQRVVSIALIVKIDPLYRLKVIQDC